MEGLIMELSAIWLRNCQGAFEIATGNSGWVRRWIDRVRKTEWYRPEGTGLNWSKATSGMFFNGRIRPNWSAPIRGAGEPGCVGGGAYLPTLQQPGS